MKVEKEVGMGNHRGCRTFGQYRVLATISITLLIFRSTAFGFNLDHRIPIIKSGGVFSDSFFGYSVAQHRTQSGSNGEPKILIGAPQDQNSQPGTNRSGAIYQCDISNKLNVSQ